MVDCACWRAWRDTKKGHVCAATPSACSSSCRNGRDWSLSMRERVQGYSPVSSPTGHLHDDHWRGICTRFPEHPFTPNTVCRDLSPWAQAKLKLFARPQTRDRGPGGVVTQGESRLFRSSSLRASANHEFVRAHPSFVYIDYRFVTTICSVWLLRNCMFCILLLSDVSLSSVECSLERGGFDPDYWVILQLTEKPMCILVLGSSHCAER